MTVSDHPELEQIKKYLNNSASAEFSDLRLHLAQCSACRELTEALMGLQDIAQQGLSEQVDQDVLTETMHEQIVDFIDAKLGATEHQQQQAFIHSNPAALKAALHYASHKSAMDKAGLQPAMDSSAVSSVGVNISRLWSAWQKKLNALFTYKAPVWWSITVTAALVAAIGASLLELSAPGPAGYKIASYQDNAIIQFRPKDHLPGIGFFAQSAEFSEAYDTLKVSVSEDGQFTIHWPPVAQAIKYSLRLQMFNQGNKTVLGEVTTEKTSAVISTKLDDIYHRYEWVLSGETSDRRVFLANGGFVIEK